MVVAIRRCALRFAIATWIWDYTWLCIATRLGRTHHTAPTTEYLHGCYRKKRDFVKKPARSVYSLLLTAFHRQKHISGDNILLPKNTPCDAS